MLRTCVCDADSTTGPILALAIASVMIFRHLARIDLHYGTLPINVIYGGTILNNSIRKIRRISHIRQNFPLWISQIDILINLCNERRICFLIVYTLNTQLGNYFWLTLIKLIVVLLMRFRIFALLRANMASLIQI